MSKIVDALIITVQGMQKQIDQLNEKLSIQALSDKPKVEQPTLLSEDDVIDIIKKEKGKTKPFEQMTTKEVNDAIDKRVTLLYVNKLYGKNK